MDPAVSILPWWVPIPADSHSPTPTGTNQKERKKKKISTAPARSFAPAEFEIHPIIGWNAGEIDPTWPFPPSTTSEGEMAFLLLFRELGPGFPLCGQGSVNQHKHCPSRGSQPILAPAPPLPLLLWKFIVLQWASQHQSHQNQLLAHEVSKNYLPLWRTLQTCPFPGAL